MKGVSLVISLVTTMFISCSKGADTGGNPEGFKLLCPVETPVACYNGQCCNWTQYCGHSSIECEDCKIQQTADNILHSLEQNNSLDLTILLTDFVKPFECREVLIQDLSRKGVRLCINVNPDSIPITTTDTPSTSPHSLTDGGEPTYKNVAIVSLCFNGIFIAIFIFVSSKSHRWRNRLSVLITSTNNTGDAKGAEEDDGDWQSRTHNLSNPRITDYQEELSPAATPSDRPTMPLLRDRVIHMDGPEHQTQEKLESSPVPQSAVVEYRSRVDDVDLGIPRPGAQQSLYAQKSNGSSINPIVNDQGGGKSEFAYN